MLFATIAAALRRLARRRADAPDGLRSADHIRRLLAVERVRADRTGDCLSVVVFAPRTHEATDATWDLLGMLLRSRLRVTDDAGWLDHDAVCAVLPFTPAAGAWKVADDVCLLFPETVPPPICIVYSYPSGNLPTVGDAASGDGSGRANPIPAERHGHRGPTDTPHPAGTGPPRPPRPASAPLEPLFLQPISPGKRLADIIGATGGLLLLLPLLLQPRHKLSLRAQCERAAQAARHPAARTQ